MLALIVGGPVRGATQYDYWVTDLGVLYGNTTSWGDALNNSGQVVGYAPSSTGSYHAFLYSGGSMADLGTLSGFPSSYAYGINDNGLVVGGLISAAGASNAFLDSNGTMTSLGAGTAYGINSSGQVVSKNGSNHAFLDSGGTMKDLGTLSGYASSAAQAVNAAGQVVGYATTSTGGTQAFLYSNGSMVGVGAPAGDAYSSRCCRGRPACAGAGRGIADHLAGRRPRRWSASPESVPRSFMVPPLSRKRRPIRSCRPPGRWS